MHNATVTYIKKDGQLVPASEREAGKLKLFNMALKEGETVEMDLSVTSDNDKSLGQLAKVHALMRELANASGHTIDEIKDQVKIKAGLYKITETGKKEFKSFTNCSKEDLSNAIETCISIGHLIGCNLY